MSRYYSFIILFIFFLSVNHIISTGKNEQSPKLTVNLNLNYQVLNSIRSVKVKVNRKENSKFIPVEGINVSLSLIIADSLNNNTPGYLIGECFTDEDGFGTLVFPVDFNKTHSNQHVFNFIAKIVNNPKYEDTEEEITITDASINITASNDSSKTVTAKLTTSSDSLSEKPVPETEMKLFIKRTFSLLPFGEEGQTTDTNGEISAELPSDIPGNQNGTLTLVAKVEDNEIYGTVESTKEIKWNVLPKPNVEVGRTLWSTGKNAPLSLVIISLIIILGVWGTIIYLITRLFKIKSLRKS